MKRVVIDTNVLVSSAISSGGNPERIMNGVSDKQLQLCYSREIIDEYKRVLAYERLKISVETQAKIVKAIEKTGLLVEPATSDFPMTDETDRIFYDTAKTSGATLVTGNVRHFPDESFIMTPSDFVKEHCTPYQADAVSNGISS